MISVEKKIFNDENEQRYYSVLGRVMEGQRLSKGYSLEDVAEKVGISVEMLSRIESGMKFSEETKVKIFQVLLDVENKRLEFLVDWMSLQFGTNDIDLVIDKVLGLDKSKMLEVASKQNNYNGYYEHGEIKVHFSEEGSVQGTLISMSGIACRQFDSILEEQGRTLRDFIECVLNNGGHATRIDLAIDDYVRILDITELKEKCDRKEFKTTFQRYKPESNFSANDMRSLGWTLYFGSKKSDFFIRFYEKDKEQAPKMETIPELVPIKNRYELQFRKKKADYVLEQLMKGEKINELPIKNLRYHIRFWESVAGIAPEDYKLWQPWIDFLGDVEKAQVKPKIKDIDYESTYEWLEKSCIQAMIALEQVDKINGTDRILQMRKNAKIKLTPKYEKMIEDLTQDIDNFLSEAYRQEKRQREFRRSMEKELKKRDRESAKQRVK